MNQGPFNSGYIPGPNVLNPPNPIAQLNPYGQSLPNLNYGIPGGNIVGSTNPLLFGSNQNINPVNPIQNSGNVNPFDPNQNFLRQQTYANPMMNPNNNFQSIPNMANNVAINDPDLQINQIMAERMIEREKVKEQTKEIYKRLSDKYDDEQDLEEMKKKQEELEEEEDKTKKKDSREERNKRRELLFGKGGLYNIPVDIYIPRSEYFYKRDRAFLEELILAPIKTMGATGRKLVTDFNKESLFDDKEAFQEQDILQLNDEDEYFERAIKDGIYLDYVKQQLFSFNINKTEQRSFREEKKIGLDQIVTYVWIMIYFLM